MLIDKEFNKAEELSQFLDFLNHGNHPIVQDEEIKELVQLASVVKQSYRQEELPQVLIDSVVDQLATELQAEKKKRRTRWLYSGLAGTAAAVVIAAFIQFLVPQALEQQIAQQLDEPKEIQKMVGDTPMIAQTTPAIIPKQEPIQEKIPVAVPMEEKAPPSVSEVLEEIVNVAKTPDIEEKPVQVAALQLEKSADRIMKKSVLMAESPINSLQMEKNSQPEVKMIMVIPNKTAQSITIDKKSGDIKQVYHLGNHDEIVITQGLTPSLTEKTKDGINSFIVKMGKYTIGIEGKKTLEELEKIAQSLVEKEMKEK